MDILYDIKEYLEIKDTEVLAETCEFVSRELEALEIGMQRKSVLIHRMSLITDTGTYAFTGGEITDNYLYLVNAFHKAKSLKLCAQYVFLANALNFEELIPTPFAIGDHINLLIKSNIELSKFIYYDMTSSSKDNGRAIRVRYGFMDGRMYFGPEITYF